MSPTPAPGSGSPVSTAACGQPSPTPFGFFDPATCLWKTWPPSCDAGSTTCRLTWPRQGTTRAGYAYAHPTSEPPTGGTGCSCWLPAGDTPTLPTPCARDAKGAGRQRGLPDLAAPGGLLPTPTAASYGTNRSRSPGAATRPSLARVATHLPHPPADTGIPDDPAHVGSRSTASPVLLPTPRASDGTKGSPGQRGTHGDPTLPSAALRVQPTPTVSDSRGPDLRTTVTDPPTGSGRWGPYTAAITRWELLLGRPAPEPTQPGTHGKPVLAPRFVEWLMGLPDGWVTHLPLPRTQALHVLGNGVVPQQAATALRHLLCPHRCTPSHVDNHT